MLLTSNLNKLVSGYARVNGCQGFFRNKRRFFCLGFVESALEGGCLDETVDIQSQLALGWAQVGGAPPAATVTLLYGICKKDCWNCSAVALVRRPIWVLT